MPLGVLFSFVLCFPFHELYVVVSAVGVALAVEAAAVVVVVVGVIGCRLMLLCLLLVVR